MRLSRSRIQEFLRDWLGITLSVGCIHQCIGEGGRAVAPLEEALVAEIQQADLLHADETGWKEKGHLLWLWVLRTATVTLYLIGRRHWDVIAPSLKGFSGWLMSDGYGQFTNNVAEQSLRHWVIARKISHGTRTPEGSRAFALLASVIDTCRQRGLSPWPYLAQVIAARRQGNAAPPIPQPIG